MKIVITKNARALVELIAKEHSLQLQRAAGGHIPEDKIIDQLVERLNAKGKRDPSVRSFLTYVGPIDAKDDEDPTKPWAEDKREARRHVVNKQPAEGSVGGAQTPDAPWPEPGERIC